MGRTRVPRSLASRALTLVLAIGLAGSLAGCDAIERGFPTAIFRPESPQARQINELAILLLVIAGVAFVVVEGWLLIAAFRFRNRPEERASQTHGHLGLETGWTAGTALVVFIVLGLTIKTMADVTAIPSAALPQQAAFPGDVMVMRVVGHQWWWTFEYPQQQVVTGNEIHVPVGRTIRAQLEAEDVIHSFWAPQLMGKTDTIPGQTNYTSFIAVRPGVYRGVCAEFCGTQHARMGFRVIADEPQDFANWLRNEQAPAAQPTTDQQRAGQQAFGPCAACHTVRGTPAQGRLGPDLTHFGSRQTIASDTLENTPENLARWIRDPQEVKPGNKMPDLNLDEATIDQLVAYLGNLK